MSENVYFSTLDEPTKENIEEVKKSLQLTQQGGVAKNKRNKIRIAEKDPMIGELVKLDRATMDICFSPRYENVEILSVETKKYYSYYYHVDLSETDVHDLITFVAYRKSFNSILDYLKTFTIPENNPLHEILSYIHFKTDQYEIYFEMFDLFFKKLSVKLLSMDVVWLSYPNDVVLIFEGSQGIGKTLLCMYFGLSDEKFYVDLGSIPKADLMSRDTLMLISGKIISEIGELQALRKNEVETVKSFVSKTFDEYRRPYARSTQKIPRTTSYIGTTNEGEYLSDSTGNRRFFPIEISKINFDLFRRQDLIKLLYGYYLKIGQEILSDSEDEARGRLLAMNQTTPELEKYLEEKRAEKRITSPYENRIFDYVEMVQKKNYIDLGRKEIDAYFEFYNCSEAGLWIFKHPQAIPRDFAKSFSAVMREQGFVDKCSRISGRKIRHWIPTIDQGGTPGTVEHLFSETSTDGNGTPLPPITNSSVCSNTSNSKGSFEKEPFHRSTCSTKKDDNDPFSANSEEDDPFPTGEPEGELGIF